MVPLLVLCLLSPLLVASQDPPALKCQQGPKGKEALVVCASGLDACMVTKDNSTMLDTEFETTFYDCGKRNSCANAFTITIADGRHLHSSSACCAEDGCNANLDWGVLPTPWKKNGYTCPLGCYVQSQAECNAGPISCRDTQMSCINATGSSGAKKFILKGCGTSNMCGVKDFELTIGGIPFQMKEILCDTPPTPEKSTTPAPATTLKPATTKNPATTKKPATTTTPSKACRNHILGNNFFLLLLPSISSIFFLKFLC